MKKSIFIFFAFLFLSSTGFAQTASDLFKEERVMFFGIDYSHVKLIGDFSQFMGAGETDMVSIRNTYFPSWNKLLMEEPEKFSMSAMIRNPKITFDVDMVNGLNARTRLELLEAERTPMYTKDSIQKFIRNYSTMQNKGLACMFVAESMNKTLNEAYYHFVVFRLTDNEIVIHERMRGEPIGIGLRNYWGGALYNIMEDLRKNYYKKWKAKYAK